MQRHLWVVFLCASLLHSCYQPDTKQEAPKRKKKFEYKETIITGTDTGMIALGPFKRSNIADLLCQRWELQPVEDMPTDLLGEFNPRESSAPGMVLFKDSSVVLNPFGRLKIGNWQLIVADTIRLLKLTFADATIQYGLDEVSSRALTLHLPGTTDVFLDFSASGVLHQNIHNDPFHPENNQWRIKPSTREPDSAVHQRLKNCLLFFALYYRDHIKRKAETISFEGLPRIFTWYNRGIGLPDKDDVSESWIDCFYDKEQALKGYSILRKLIVDYEYNWPKGAPGWTYATHAVLEQMYHKIDKLKE